MKLLKSLSAIFVIVLVSTTAVGQGKGMIQGKVRLSGSGDPVHDAKVTIIQLKLSTTTAIDGSYSFDNVPAGKYDLSTTLERMPNVLTSIEIMEGQSVTVDFEIRLDALREQVTVTASGQEETTLRSIASVTIIGSLDLARKNPISLGEALDNELGVAKRSFGPGNSRPVVRGFDGDRVLVLQEGVGVGGLGFQSGDHAEPIDLLSQDRVEVVKGPATLLYGSNAIGGVVNAISGHEEPHPGLRGYLTGIAGSTSNQTGVSGGIEFGNTNWLLWGNGGGQYAGDYHSPLGPVINSFAHSTNLSGGLGYFSGKRFLTVSYTNDRRNYGVPNNPGQIDSELVRLNPRRNGIQFRGGFRDIGSFLSGGNFTLQYNDYRHSEIDVETKAVNTSFKNSTLIYRAVFEENRTGRLSGSFGLSGSSRDFRPVGLEVLAPPTKHQNFAAFGLQSLDFGRVALQFGGRLERNAYNPEHLRNRAFLGFSGSTGIRVDLEHDNVFVANFSHSYRAPALEELYNNGPHPGNLTYEIGNSSLGRERSDGLDLSLRHASKRMRTELNYFYYHMKDFIYLAPTGHTVDSLVEATYSQGLTRFTGAEARLDLGLTGNLWLLSSMDYVNAQLSATSTPLPRIPPLRGRIGFEAYARGLRINPELIMARDQNRLFTNETSTPGYAIVNMNTSYAISGKHASHIFTVTAFNLTNKLYRNHLSFIKQFAPEIGRGVRIVYSVRFY